MNYLCILRQDDIGYYIRLQFQNLRDKEYFIELLNEDYDTVSKGISETKMSIRYFDVKESGIHTMIHNKSFSRKNKL